MNDPEKRGRKAKGYVKPEKRTQWPAEEVEFNRDVAGERWVEEATIGMLKHDRLYQTTLDLTTVRSANMFLSISAGRVNRNSRSCKKNRTKINLYSLCQ